MRFLHLAVSSSLILWAVHFKVSEAGTASLAANVSSADGIFCPGVVKFTCVAENVPSSSLVWFYNGNIAIAELNFVFLEMRPVPFLVENTGLPTEAFISYTIVRAMVNSGVVNSNFTAEAVADIEVMFDLGYRSLHCVSFPEMGNLTINGLDIEVPFAPHLVSTDLIYDIMSSGSVEQLRIQTQRSVYNSSNPPCQYRENTFLNTSVRVGDNTVSSTITSIRTCGGENCIVGVTDIPEPVGSGGFQVSITAANRFGESPPTLSTTMFSSPIQSTLNFSVSYESCTTFVHCFALQELAIANCTILYGEDSSYQDFESFTGPTNERFPLTELDSGTTYYLEAVFTIRNNRAIENYRLRTTFRTGEDTCNEASSTIVVAVVSSIAAVMVMTLIVLIILLILALLLRKKSHSGSVEVGTVESMELHNGSDGGGGNSGGAASGTSQSSEKKTIYDDEIILSEEFKGRDENTANAFERVAKQEIDEEVKQQEELPTNDQVTPTETPTAGYSASSEQCTLSVTIATLI